jgi:hypothetical protein
MSIIVVLPLRLVSEANAHEHWCKRQQRAREQRTHTRSRLWVPARNLLAEYAFPIVVTITRIAPRKLDSDNAVGACKHVRDGVADALGINDNDPRVEWRYGQRKARVTTEWGIMGPMKTPESGTSYAYGVEIRIDSAASQETAREQHSPTVRVKSRSRRT